jgi:hypothetical protein
VAVLESGGHWMFDPLGRAAIQTYDLTMPEFEHPRVDFLLAAGAAPTRHVQVVVLRFVRKQTARQARACRAFLRGSQAEMYYDTQN